MPPREISVCERSTITEAWAFAVGLPGPLVTEEAAALVLAARRRWPDLAVEPATPPRIMDSSTALPTWTQQWVWEQRRFLARIGHRYLSVHVLADASRPYLTYEDSLRPALLAWLEICSDVYSDPRQTNAIDRVGFGYVNTFSFTEEGFDLSSVVNLKLGLGVASASRGLTNMRVDVGFEDPETNHDVLLLVSAEPVNDETVMVKTRVAVEAPTSSLSFSSPSQAEREIHGVKSVAKRIFFEFVTDKIHETMGAQYVSVD